MFSRLAPEFGPAAQQLLELAKAMTVPCHYGHDAAHQEKCLLLLLTDQEPDARQLLQQHLHKAEKAKLDGADEELASSNFPGAAFTTMLKLSVSRRHGTKANKAVSDSSSAVLPDGSSPLGAGADMAGHRGPEPSAGLCKALDAALFITKQHGELRGWPLAGATVLKYAEMAQHCKRGVSAIERRPCQ
jgi:hypothetical protein